MSKVVFITGVSSGLGRATAYYLANKGYKVYGTSRVDQEVPINFTILKMDVLDEESVKDAVQDVIRKERKIDILVNNAGIGMAGAAEDTSIAEMKQVFETNFFGLVRVTQIVLPYMRQQKSGLIINIGSLGGRIALPFQPFYSASKFAVQGFTESLRVELMPFNVRATVINAGDFKTSFTTNRIIAASTKEDSPYYKQYRLTKGVILRDEDTGADPKAVAKLIYRISNKKHPRISYRTGLFYQTFLVSLKPLAPSALLDYALKRYYRIKI